MVGCLNGNRMKLYALILVTVFFPNYKMRTLHKHGLRGHGVCPSDRKGRGGGGGHPLSPRSEFQGCARPASPPADVLSCPRLALLPAPSGWPRGSPASVRTSDLGAWAVPGPEPGGVGLGDPLPMMLQGCARGATGAFFSPVREGATPGPTVWTGPGSQGRVGWIPSEVSLGSVSAQLNVQRWRDREEGLTVKVPGCGCVRDGGRAARCF